MKLQIFVILFLSPSLYDGFQLNCNIAETSPDDLKSYQFVSKGMTCYLRDQFLTEPNEAVTSINDGSISIYKEVNVLRISRSYSKIPEGIEKFFPNIEALILQDLISLKKSDLAPFSNLKVLIADYNRFEFLEEDLFASNLELQFIFFHGNPLKFVSENILKPLTKLETVQFTKNFCIDKFAWNKGDIGDMELLKVKLKTNCSNHEFLVKKEKECQSVTLGE
jgi:hypothetical protein